MESLVERLRKQAAPAGMFYLDALLREAADEIDRLNRLLAAANGEAE